MLAVWGYNALSSVFIFLMIFTLLYRKLVEELLLILKLPIFVYPNSRIRRSCRYKLHQWMHSHSLNKFFMSFQCLNLSLFGAVDLPNNGCPVQRSRNQKLRIIWPAEIHDISDMASKLPRMAPLNHFFDFAKLDWHGLELPNDDHLVVRSAGQELTIGRKSYTVDCFGVASRQIVQVRWLGLERRIILNAIRETRPSPNIEVFDTLFLRVRLCTFSFVLPLFFELPKLDSRILESHVACGDEVSAVRIHIHSHQLVLLVVPQNLRDINLHCLNNNYTVKCYSKKKN